MKVALVHDDLMQWGGAERVLLGLSDIFPDAPIFTSVFDYSNFWLWQKFGKKKVVTSFLQKIPGWKTLYKTLLPFYPIAFEQFSFDGFDLVISHTTRFAKNIITKPETLHICYCHTPPRFLWRFSGYKSYGLGEVLMSKLRLYDQVSANRVDHFIAGSQNAKKRIEKVYRKDSKVVYPFVDLERFKEVESFDGGYFVIVGRPNKYKHFDLVKKVCDSLKVSLKVVDGGLTDEMVVQILAGCKALIVCAEEDFGLTSLEAQALGKPVVAFGRGGALETVIEGKTGIFFDAQNEESLKKALVKLESTVINSDDCRKNAADFNKEIFMKSFRQSVADLL